MQIIAELATGWPAVFIFATPFAFLAFVVWVITKAP